MTGSSLTRKDAGATVLTLLAVLVFLASRQAWDLSLVGTSHRWASGVILVLGMAACTLGSPGNEMAKKPFAMLLAVTGGLALGFAVWGIWTGSLTALTLLVVADIVLWAGSTFRHGRYSPLRTASIR